MTSYKEGDQPRAPAPTRSPRPDVTKQNRVDEAVAAYHKLYRSPAITRATFVQGTSTSDGVSDHSSLVVETSHKSISTLSKRSATQTLTLNRESNVMASSPVTFTSADVQHVAVSPDGQAQAVFRSVPAKEGKEARKFVEIVGLQHGNLVEEIEVTKEHGDWYFDTTFGTATWHPESHSLLYVAEAPKPKNDTKLPIQATFKYTPDFGETFTGRRNPCIFLLALSQSPFRKALDNTEDRREDISNVHRLTRQDDFPSIDFGQPVFLPDGAEGQPRLLATGYSRLGDNRKLGIVYCANRPAAIYDFTVTAVESNEDDKRKRSWRATEALPQSDTENRSARSARVLQPPSVESKRAPLVVFLSNPVGGPHSSCASLHAAALPSKNSNKPARTTVLVPVVDKVTDLSQFPGLYVDQLPQKCFLETADGPAVVMTSIWRSRRVPLLVNLRSGKVENLLPWPKPNEDDVVLPYLGKSDELESIGVLGTDGGSKIVGLRSSFRGPPSLVIGDLSSRKNGALNWKVVKSPKLDETVAAALSKVHFTVLPLPKSDKSEVILVSPVPIDPAAPAQRDLPPLITLPHGGPHSTTTTDWSLQVVCMVLAGYRVALVNYPGSLGFGQDFVDSLPPALGTLEVDATLATGHYLNTLSLASRTKGKKFIMGGSHGGWITAHLSARFPDEYDAAVMRNPVVDLASMLYATDIPDWTYAETELPYSLSRPPIAVSPQDYERLHSVSPLSSVHQVTLPTMLMIGKDDRRVPPDQGRTWYHALKGNNKGEVEMLAFDGNGHALDSTVECELVHFEAGLRFLDKYTSW